MVVRLADGTSAREGRVEILYNGIWGTVCGIEWDLHEASAVCRQLGYDGAVAAPPWPAFGLGSSKMIAMNHIQCTGHESSVSDCSFMPWLGKVAVACRALSASAVCAHSGKIQ